MKRIKFLGQAFVLGAALSYSVTGNTRPRAKAYTIQSVQFYNVAHRGARGYAPENSVPAFKRAVDLGANSIEFDVHLTKDSQLVIYHDALLSPNITVQPDESVIPPNKKNEFVIYKMEASALRKFFNGVKTDKSFKDQKAIKTNIPLLVEMIDSVERYTKQKGLSPIIYFLEIKIDPNFGPGDPAPKSVEVGKKVLQTLKPYQSKLKNRLIILSSTPEVLKYIHKINPKIPLAISFAQNNHNVGQMIKNLGFVPRFYILHGLTANCDLNNLIRVKGMKIITWGLNDPKDMIKMIDLGTDGILTDYPDRLNDILNPKPEYITKKPLP